MSAAICPTWTPSAPPRLSGSDYRAAYDSLAAIQREIAALEMDEAEKSRRIDSLNFQIGELERAGLKAGRRRRF